MNHTLQYPACTRRLALGALSTLPSLPNRAMAADRIPYGGTLQVTCPSLLDRLDPHQSDDLGALYFSHAVFSPLYGLTNNGAPFAALARGLPKATARGFEIHLRGGLQSASGKQLDANAVRYSLERAHAVGAHPFAQQLHRVRALTTTKVSMELREEASFAATEVARWLASPLLAVVPRGFTPTSPDGSGAFGAQIRTGTPNSLYLSRNTRAARGASYLSSIIVRSTTDLAEPLRRFEGGQDDIGWLGRGLHSPRSGARIARSGPLGWLVLRTGSSLGRWSRPGVAFELANAIVPEALSPLGVQGLSSGSGGSYRGPTASLLVPSSNPQLTAIAGGLAEALNADGRSRLEVVPMPRGELLQRLRSRKFGIALTAERPLALGPHGVLQTLHGLAGSRRALRTYPATQLRSAVDHFCRTQEFTVLGTLHAQVGHMNQYAGLAAWDLGAVFRS